MVTWCKGVNSLLHVGMKPDHSPEAVQILSTLPTNEKPSLQLYSAAARNVVDDNSLRPFSGVSGSPQLTTTATSSVTMIY